MPRLDAACWDTLDGRHSLVRGGHLATMLAVLALISGGTATAPPPPPLSWSLPQPPPSSPSLVAVAEPFDVLALPWTAYVLFGAVLAALSLLLFTWLRYRRRSRRQRRRLTAAGGPFPLARASLRGREGPSISAERSEGRAAAAAAEVEGAAEEEGREGGAAGSGCSSSAAATVWSPARDSPSSAAVRSPDTQVRVSCGSTHAPSPPPSQESAAAAVAAVAGVAGLQGGRLQGSRLQSLKGLQSQHALMQGAQVLAPAAAAAPAGAEGGTREYGGTGFAA